ncbi:hypothetical protein [Xanthomonas citri]|uniref:hypothetical protein n=1 Tax=Xanthomonas citri TaxID=346 RepID=UPI001A943950|nr:hypothetical protein [Xanthomonas citri]
MLAFRRFRTPDSTRVVLLIARYPLLLIARRRPQVFPQLDGAKVRVAYQTERAITWNGSTENLCGRTLEEDFGLENAEWSQAAARKSLGLIVKGGAADPYELARGLNKKVSGKSFDKTKFALALLTENEDTWHVPAYIRDGLVWLRDEVRIEVENVLPDIVLNGEVAAPGEEHD